MRFTEHRASALRLGNHADSNRLAVTMNLNTAASLRVTRAQAVVRLRSARGPVGVSFLKWIQWLRFSTVERPRFCRGGS